MAIRAAVHRTRGGVPVATTLLVNVWERFSDLAALCAIAGMLAVLTRGPQPWSFVLLTPVALSMIPTLRRDGLSLASRALASIASRFDNRPPPPVHRLVKTRTWFVTVAVSVVAWMLPGAGLWLLANAWAPPQLNPIDAQIAYAVSTTVGGLSAAPGGVIVAGAELLAMLERDGLGVQAAVLTVFAVRTATAGVTTVLGAVFVLLHLRSAAPAADSHFDLIADAYDVQIPESRRLALLERKTALMQAVMRARGGGCRGLDVGCGRGWYVKAMRDKGFEVDGIDASAGQVALARAHVGPGCRVSVGSALEIPAETGTYDFVYVINVLHHLPSVESQRAAFKELFRVLRPGGLLFVHEINTRNVLFRFYMGYVFPSLNCIDEGIERWLLPDELSHYTDVPMVDMAYFTFFPDFLPESLVRWGVPLERRLEASRFGKYSAHYMAVFQTPA
jgi:SAM-dependent methyltransferase